ncbi:MAG: hypothetical protein GX256_07055 [Fretibacterium sp.]|nr:hypothetical protein [Fretibacterium sp.]
MKSERMSSLNTWRRRFLHLLPLLVLVAAGLGFPCEAEAKVYVAEPLLVAQPAYAGMRFYVYQPYEMPKGWYVTFDGYAVKKNADGVWVYGTMSGPNLTPTNYVVGSVVPSMAGLSPWAQSHQISSIISTQDLASAGTRKLEVSQPTGLKSPQGLQKAYSTWVPDWTFNPRFMAIGTWQKTVDRIGVLHNPATPVAWKGNRPKVIYVWTGSSWYQVTVRESQRPVDALKNRLYDLVRMVKRTQFVWYEPDTPVLAQHATMWGYYWMGEVVPAR